MDRRALAYTLAAVVLGFTAHRGACAAESALAAAFDGASPAGSALAPAVTPTTALDDGWSEGAPAEAVQDAADACGVLAIPRSPAQISVSLDGGVPNVAVESELFGGPDSEACIAAHLAAHGPIRGHRARTVRYALETFFP